MSKKHHGMKNSVAAAALLLASAASHAQSNITIYGLLDAGLVYTNKTLNSVGGNGGRQLALNDGGTDGSRFGIRGNEDLGGGLSAMFDLESGIKVDTGALGNSNGNFFGRQAWIGLAGGFGMFQIGQQFSPFVLSLIGSDPRNASYFGSGAAIYVGNVFDTGLFTPNAMSYTSPVWSGLQASAMLALGEQAGNFQAGRQYSGRLRYTYDGWAIDTALFNGNAGGASTPIPTTVDFSGRTVGITYSAGALTVKTSYTDYKLDKSFNSHVVGAGFGYQITPALLTNMGVWYTRDANDTANHSILTAVGTEYALSKRTSLYAQVGFVDNHGKMNTGLSLNGALYEGAGSTTGISTGVRHSF